MQDLETLLRYYDADISCWSDDFAEGDQFLQTREQLIPFEDDERVKALDQKALEVIKNDHSKGQDRIFLNALKDIILKAQQRIESR